MGCWLYSRAISKVLRGLLALGIEIRGLTYARHVLLHFEIHPWSLKPMRKHFQHHLSNSLFCVIQSLIKNYQHTYFLSVLPSLIILLLSPSFS